MRALRNVTPTPEQLKILSRIRPGRSFRPSWCLDCRPANAKFFRSPNYAIHQITGC
jgi:hypothetical protein